MAHIDVTRPHRLGLARARQAAEEIAGTLRARFGVQTAWDGDTLRLDSAGVRGTLTATADAVRVSADLGLPLRPLRRRLQREIEQHLDRFAQAAS